MFLRELFEGPGKEASFALGRMNPAHRGHGLLVEAIKQGPGDAFLFLTDRAAKVPTDPLSPQEKLDWAQKSFPDITIALAKNIFPVAVDLHNRGYTDITIFEGEDKLRPLLEKYNGTEAAHGFFEFQSINQKKLSRDADADDASGASATKLRQAAMDGDFETFEDNVSDAAKPYAKKMFEKLQGILGSKQEENINEAAPLVIIGLGRFLLWAWKNKKWLMQLFAVGGVGIGINELIKMIEPYKHLILGVLAILGLAWSYKKYAPLISLVFAGGDVLYDKLKNTKSEEEAKEVIENHNFDKKLFNDLMAELEGMEQLKAKA
jgi:nicotinamide mononucleotide adenylyltransferase